MKKLTLLLVFLVGFSSAALSQTVGQGSAADVADAWPIKVVFSGAAVDPRLVTVQNASLAVTGTFWPTTAGAPASHRLSDGAAFYDARLIRLLTSGDQITIANASLAVTGTFWQATQPVSGPLTDDQLRDSEVAVFLKDGDGNDVNTETSLPGTSERGLVVRNIDPSYAAIADPAADGSNLAGAKVDTSNPSYTTGTQQPLSLTTAGLLRASVLNTVTVGGTVAIADVNGTAATSAATPASIARGLVVRNVDRANIDTGSTTPTSANLIGTATTTAAPVYVTGTMNPLSTTLGGSLRTDIVAALPAGANAIGKLAANSGVDVGDVTLTAGSSIVGSVGIDQTTPGTTNRVDVGVFPDNEPFNVAQMNGVAVTMNNGGAGTGVQRVTLASDSTGNIATIGTSVTPGTAAANLGKAEDAVHTTADVGVFALGVRNDGTATTYGANNDYSPIATDAQGAVFTTPTTKSYMSIAGQESVAAPTADVWYIRKQWALPASARFAPSHAWAQITTALTKTLVVVVNNLGNLNVGTNTYTAANSVASPLFYGRLFGCVTTVLSATGDTITPTYTDELGNSQAATGVAFALSSPVGNCYEFPLAAGTPASSLDSGVRAVTAAVDTAATTGVVTFYGVNTLADFAGTAASQTETQQFPQAIELSVNEQIAIIMRQAATTAQLKTFGVGGSLR